MMDFWSPNELLMWAAMAVIFGIALIGWIL